MSLRRPTAAAIATKQGLLDVLTGLYDRAIKPDGGNLTEFIKTVVNAGASSAPAGRWFPLTSGGSASSRHDASGAEFLSYGWAVPFSQLPATLTLVLCLFGSSAGGVATFRARVGGGYRTITGSVVALKQTASATPVPLVLVATISNPGQDGTIKLTQQSSANGVDCMADEAGGLVFG